MKIAQSFVFAALVGCLSLSSRAETQIFFSGHITSSTGIYAGQYSAGDLVVLSLDFVNTTDAWHGTKADFATYRPIVQFSIENQVFPLVSPADPRIETTFISKPSLQGLSIDKVFQNNSDFLEFSQDVLATHNVGVTRNIFPGGIPFNEFSFTDGFIRNYFEMDGTFHDRGMINWTMENDVGSAILPPLPEPPPLTPVPEPSTYGLFGALTVTLLIGFRRRGDKWSDHVAGLLGNNKA